MNYSTANADVVSPAVPSGGTTRNIWVRDETAPVLTLINSETTAEDEITLTLQLDEPGTIWCQAFEKYSHMAQPTLTNQDYKLINHVGYIQGDQARGTQFRAFVSEAYDDVTIVVNRIESSNRNSS